MNCLPMKSDIVRSLVENMDNYSVSFSHIYGWPREKSIHRDNHLLFAKAFDDRVLNLKYMKLP